MKGVDVWYDVCKAKFVKMVVRCLVVEYAYENPHNGDYAHRWVYSMEVTSWGLKYGKEEWGEWNLYTETHSHLLNTNINEKKVYGEKSILTISVAYPALQVVIVNLSQPPIHSVNISPLQGRTFTPLESQSLHSRYHH